MTAALLLLSMSRCITAEVSDGTLRIELRNRFYCPIIVPTELTPGLNLTVDYPAGSTRFLHGRAFRGDWIDYPVRPFELTHMMYIGTEIPLTQAFYIQQIQEPFLIRFIISSPHITSYRSTWYEVSKTASGSLKLAEAQ